MITAIFLGLISPLKIKYKGKQIIIDLWNKKPINIEMIYRRGCFFIIKITETENIAMAIACLVPLSWK
jgi:hypothetical protein